MNWRINVLLIWLVAALGACNSNSEPKQIDAADYASSECLIEAEELSNKLNSKNRIKLIDLRKPADFAQGHIENSINVWRNQITDTSYNYDGMMPTQTQVETLLSQLGINPSDTIVIYDDKAECDAARLWWILKFYGHKHIKLLNGGLKSWLASGEELSTITSNSYSSEYRFTANHDSTILALHQLVAESFNDSELVLLDTRGTEEYSAQTHKDGAARPGHIENAKDFDWSMAVDYEGTQKFLPVEELKSCYATIGIDGTKSVITYCHSGVRSAHTLFVLTELLGYRNIKNYDGSWIEWSHLHPE